MRVDVTERDIELPFWAMRMGLPEQGVQSGNGAVSKRAVGGFECLQIDTFYTPSHSCGWKLLMG